MDIIVRQGQIVSILVTFGWILDEKLAKVCLTLPGVKLLKLLKSLNYFAGTEITECV